MAWRSYDLPPWLPLMFVPWTLLPWLWTAVWRARPLQDEGLRFCLIWLLGGLVLLSLVSGKQLKYRITSYNVCYTKLLRLHARSFALRCRQTTVPTTTTS